MKTVILFCFLVTISVVLHRSDAFVAIGGLPFPGPTSKAFSVSFDFDDFCKVYLKE